MDKTIDDVRSFWDSNPLLTGELDAPVGSEEWFRNFDEIKTNEIFAGDLSDWISSNLEGKRVLDVGCGPGYWNRIFGNMNVEYHGIDISPKTIAMATKSKKLFSLVGTLEVGNAERLDFPDEYFDFVVSEGVIHHTPDTQRCINEIFRVLKKGGCARVGVYYKNLALRSRALFTLSLALMRTFNISLKGRGRNKMTTSSTPEELVRMYDGKDNPIGKAYTKSELKGMFGEFDSTELTRYYFPTRVMRVRLPRIVQRWLNSAFGLMVLAKVRK
jgi:SAM-dependent methyltransferase